MNAYLDDKLCQQFPKIFANRAGDPTTTLMCFGFEHGDGWYNIIREMCSTIQSYLDWKNRKEQTVPQVVATQVKEKFGTLRFYYEGGDDYIRGVVSMAEAMTANTCEVCGNPGHQRTGGWIRTLCDEHAPKKDNHENP